MSGGIVEFALANGAPAAFRADAIEAIVGPGTNERRAHVYLTGGGEPFALAQEPSWMESVRVWKRELAARDAGMAQLRAERDAAGEALAEQLTARKEVEDGLRDEIHSYRESAGRAVDRAEKAEREAAGLRERLAGDAETSERTAAALREWDAGEA